MRVYRHAARLMVRHGPRPVSARVLMARVLMTGVLLAGVLLAGVLLAGVLLAGVLFSAPLLAQSSSTPATDFAVQDENLANRVQEALKTCFSCHGAGGVSQTPTRPTIAGQKAAYLAHQLKAFKAARLSASSAPQLGEEGGRTSPIMNHQADVLDDALIEPIAKTLSEMTCHGQKRSLTNLRPIPLPETAYACVSCHGKNGISASGEVPNLAGQQRTYLRRQLLLIRETAWGAQPRKGEAQRSHPIMEAETARFRIRDIDEIAHYYSALDCGGDASQSPASQ